ncbi:MAG: Polynucleotide adenylyltransferase [Deltaproteobacteria bacterium]|nr:Polynucleotide adenylyltransferase [Deltaproteobacteria bacterium]
MDQPAIPRILSRQEHPISRKTIDPDALKVLYRLHQHGFIAYLVGGCVRDLLLGKTPKDFDVATDAHPRQIREIFRNSRLIGRRFRLAHVYFSAGKYIEVSTFRRHSEFEEEDPEAHPHSDNTFGTPAEDAMRRDITINGIFYDIADFSLVDYVGGLEDLSNGVVRSIGDPDEKFVQDPVRMIRVIRHAARTGFRIEEKTYRALITHVENLRLCSPARVRDEFLRELREGSAKESMRLMIETGMLFVLFPSFLVPFEDEKRKVYFLNSMKTLDQLHLLEEKVSDELSLALLLHPFLEFYCPMEEFPAGRKGQPEFLLKVREWLMQILGPFSFTRYSREAAAQLLAHQRTLREFEPLGRLPLRLVRRPEFSQVLLLFQLAGKARGEEPITFSGPLEGKKFHRRKRKRRFRRKTRRQTGDAPAADEPPPGDPEP